MTAEPVDQGIKQIWVGAHSHTLAKRLARANGLPLKQYMDKLIGDAGNIEASIESGIPHPTLIKRTLLDEMDG